MAEPRPYPLDIEAMRVALGDIDGILGDPSFLTPGQDWMSSPAEAALAGWKHLMGKGVEVDHGTAVQQLEVAARGGDPEAQHNLGYMRLHGLGGPVDTREAARLFRSASGAGVPEV